MTALCHRCALEVEWVKTNGKDIKPHEGRCRNILYKNLDGWTVYCDCQGCPNDWNPYAETVVAP